MKLEVNNIELTSIRIKLAYGVIAILIISLALILVTGVVLSATSITLFVLFLVSVVTIILFPFAKYLKVQR